MRHALILTLALSFAALPATPAQAQRLMTVKEVTYSSDSASARLLAEMEKPETKAKAAEMGLSLEEAKSRVAGMSEQEVRHLLKSNGVQEAGGDVVISLTTVLLIVIIVLLVR